ncbi:MAG TPA: DNA recombination protein RmuC [Stellaceae bacterium]|nr:DNA recombination protein RmuC [Stellaceae bacterium]
MATWYIVASIVAVCVAGGASWLVAASKLLAAATETTQLRSQIGKAEEDLKAARHEANIWRSQAENEGKARAVAESAASRVGPLETACDDLRAQLQDAAATVSRLETKLTEQEQAHHEKIEALSAIRAEMATYLKTVTSDSLRDNQAAFLRLANEVLDKHTQGASAELTALTLPIRETLQACQLNLVELEKARIASSGELTAELKNVVAAQHAVRGETARLVNALRAAPKTRGRWGENTLRNVLELSGLNPHCDFAMEQSYARDGALSRPDVVIRLPGGRSIIVDAKAPMAAYLDAVDAIDDAERERCLALHAKQLRAQVSLLAGKAYWDGLTQTPDYVVMFVPGENFYAAAAERDPELFEFAAAQRVLIVTPATLIALAKAVAYGWRQQKVAENAKRVHELGRDLYKRLSVMGGHILGLGTSLSGSVRKYNDLVGSLESSVMPQARRFHELEVEGTGSELSVLAPVDLEPRRLRAGRDISLAALADPAVPGIAG